MTKLFKCDTCGNEFNDPFDALACESVKLDPRFEIGDTVYVYDQEWRQYQPRFVTDVVANGHGWMYGLDRPFCGAFGQWWGIRGPRSGKYQGRALEEQLLLLGDKLVGTDGVLTKEMITE